MKKIRCMKELEIFSALDLAERERIGALARKRVYRKNEFVFREGEPADAIYLIKYGRMKLFRPDFRHLKPKGPPLPGLGKRAGCI